MGNCASVQDRTEKARSDEIDKQIEEDSRKFRKECKILLLGEYLPCHFPPFSNALRLRSGCRSKLLPYIYLNASRDVSHTTNRLSPHADEILLSYYIYLWGKRWFMNQWLCMSRPWACNSTPMFSSLGRAQKFHRVSPTIRSALQQRRQVSQYNHHVARLTSDQVEVSYGTKSLFLNIYSFCKLLIMKKGN